MVSLLMHNSNYGGYSQGKQRLKRHVLRRLRMTDSDVADSDVTKLVKIRIPHSLNVNFDFQNLSNVNANRGI